MNCNIASASDFKVNVEKLQDTHVCPKWKRDILVLFVVGVVETAFVM
jgi:hypothetical protein